MSEVFLAVIQLLNGAKMEDGGKHNLVIPLSKCSWNRAGTFPPRIMILHNVSQRLLGVCRTLETRRGLPPPKHYERPLRKEVHVNKFCLLLTFGGKSVRGTFKGTVMRTAVMVKMSRYVVCSITTQVA